MAWKLDEIWNNSFENYKTRETLPRDYIWATELGKSDIDIYKRLRGDKPTNPPDSRARRKFEAGEIWESIIKMVLLRAGVIQSMQEHLSYQYDGLMKVTGRLDFKAGGKPNYKQALELLENGEFLLLPEATTEASKQIIQYLNTVYPEGLDMQVVEVKSLSSNMFNLVEKYQTPKLVHSLQIFHYLKSLDCEKGVITYIDRDSARIISFIISKDDIELEKIYRDKIQKITEYYIADTEPPIEKILIWDELQHKFTTNWNVMYSAYLTELYGYEHQEEYRTIATKMSSAWNRVLTRIAKGDKMTKSNEEYLTEMQSMFPNLDILINDYKINYKGKDDEPTDSIDD